jgi:hypothetical protein
MLKLNWKLIDRSHNICIKFSDMLAIRYKWIFDWNNHIGYVYSRATANPNCDNKLLMFLSFFNENAIKSERGSSFFREAPDKLFVWSENPKHRSTHVQTQNNHLVWPRPEFKNKKNALAYAKRKYVCKIKNTLDQPAGFTVPTVQSTGIVVPLCWCEVRIGEANRSNQEKHSQFFFCGFI